MSLGSFYLSVIFQMSLLFQMLVIVIHGCLTWSHVNVIGYCSNTLLLFDGYWGIEHDISEVRELPSHQGFRHVIGNHTICQTVLYLHVAFLDLVCEEEVFYMQMSRMFTCAGQPIFLQFH